MSFWDEQDQREPAEWWREDMYDVGAYIIVDNGVEAYLARWVSFAIEQGYLPVGGLCVRGEGRSQRFAQAMCRPESI